ncbi:MAG: alpha/beta fold hydrolase [Cyclobacteriaceae bacterium]|nr:alpha/beta fold hydrolase [Cyclobacteriaceae bacterium]
MNAREKVEVAGHGMVSVEIDAPDQPGALVVLAHGAGAGMHHAFMKSLALELTARNFAVIRFNFPFTEAGRFRPDSPAVAIQAIDAVAHYAAVRFPKLPFFLTGKSFGGRMASHWALNAAIPVTGLVFYGFPLHPANKPDTRRAAHLPQIQVPMLFVQGTKDALAEPTLLSEVVGRLPNARLEWIEGADHGFLLRKQMQVQVLADLTASWCQELG